MVETVTQEDGGPSQQGMNESSASVASQVQEVVPVYEHGAAIVPEMTSDKNETARGAVSSGEEITMIESMEAADELFQTMVRETLEPTKCYHKELLFGLFLHSNDAELSALADKAKSPRLSDSVAQRKRRRDEGGKSSEDEKTQSQSSPAADGNTQRPGKRARTSLSLTWDAEFGKPSTLSLLPRALLTAPGVDDPEVGASTSPASRWSYDLELENIVAKRFRTSSIGKKALSVKKQRVASASLKEDRKGESRGEKTAFVPFSLVYNECSMSTLAAWALRKNDSPEDTEAKALSASETIYRPVPMAMFRRCSGCHEWGHYEVECKNLGPDKTIQLSHETKVQMAKLTFFNESKKEQSRGRSSLPAQVRFSKRQREKSAPKEVELDPSSALGIPCDACNTLLQNESSYVCYGCSRAFHAQCLDGSESVDVPSFAWLCGRCEDCQVDVSSDTELEGCEGFVIEQRKRQRSNDAENEDVEWGFPRDGWSSLIGLSHGVRNKDNADINPFGGMFESESESLAPGDVCWTRRNGEELCSVSEQDGWWPSVVASLQATDSLSTTYRVKRFALRESNCTTSVALPFFQHFERLGYSRVKGNHAHSGSEVSRSFEKALNMALGKCGFTSLSHALQRAREICGGIYVSVEDSETQVEGWSDAEETNQDRFLVRAKRDPMVDFMTGNEHPTALLSGSVVAWCPDLPNTIADNEASPVLHVGVVLAANLGDELALVRPIRDWQDALSQASREDSFVVRSCAVGSSRWLRMADLHMISSGAPARVTSKFSNELLPKMISDERERLKRSYQEARKTDAAQQLRVLGSPDGDFPSVEFLTSSREVDPPVDAFAAHNKRSKAAQATLESGQNRILEHNDIPLNAERFDSDEAMIYDEFVAMDTSDYEDTDNAGEVANNIVVNEIAGSSNKQHAETQSCQDADKVSTKNVAIREETTRFESEAKRAQLVVDRKEDYETAIAVMAHGGTKPPSGNAEVAVENTESVSSNTALENGKEHYAAFLAAGALEEWRRRAEEMTSATTALDPKASIPELTAVTAREGKSSTGSTESTTATALTAKACTDSTESTAATALDVEVPSPGSTVAIALNAESSNTELCAAVASKAKASNAESTTATTLNAKASSTEPTASIALDANASSAESTTVTALNAKASSTEPAGAAEDKAKFSRADSTTATQLNAEASRTESTAAVVPKARASSTDSDAATTLNGTASSAELTAAAAAAEAKPSGTESTTTTALNAKASSTEPTSASTLGAEQALDSVEFNPKSEQLQGNGMEAETSAIDAKMKELAEKGIYQVEAILDDRQVVVGPRRGKTIVTEYLIKWVGYSMEDCTWEPKNNILDRIMLQKYVVDKIYNSLGTRPSVFISNTASNRVLQALEVGRQRLDKLISFPPDAEKIDEWPPAPIRRLCPFCCTSFSQRNIGPHMRKYSSAENFDLLKEAALVAEEEWYS